MLHFKPIPGYEKYYSINNDGVVFSTKTNRILLPGTFTNGYLYVRLRNNGVRKNELVHRLVALTFLETSLGMNYVNHIDGNKANNSAENLEWCTRSMNMIHSIHVLGKNREYKSKPVIDTYSGLKFKSTKDLSIHIGISYSHCRALVSGRHKTKQYKYYSNQG